MFGGCLTPAVTAIVAASALPAVFAFSSSSSSSKSSNFTNININTNSLSFLSSPPNRLGLTRNFTASSIVPNMDSPTSLHNPSQENGSLPDLLTEYMVDMKCDACVNAVKNKLQTVDGVKSVEEDLSNQVVRILGSSPVKTMTEALEQIGRKARLIGQGVPEDFLVSAVVAEFKGPEIFGVVRLAQVSMEMARIEANFSCLSPGKHGWSINEYGDMTRGVASTWKVFNPSNEGTAKEVFVLSNFCNPQFHI